MAGWIVHRPDRPKPYLARFQPRGGRAVSRSFKSRRDAEHWLKVQAVDKRRGEWVDPRRGDITLTEWSEGWLAGRRVRPTTAARDKSYVGSLILPTLGKRPLNRLTPDELRRWLANLEASGKAPATIQKAWQILSQMVSQAVDDGRLARSPLPRRPNLPKAQRDDMKVLTPDQVHQLADAIDARYRVMVLVAAYTGLRWGETAGLRLSDVDILRRTINVGGTLTEVAGVVRRGPPKTKRSSRKLTISKTLAQELGEHVGLFADPDGWIFSAPNGGPIRATNWRRRVWAPAVRAVDLEPLRFHDLRHTHASMLIAQGEHPKVIAERLGHSSITVTLDVYGHLMPGIDDLVAERLDAAMKEAGGSTSSSLL
jgi:integrase